MAGKILRPKRSNTLGGDPFSGAGGEEVSRVIVWFSCGAPSACAAKLALDRFGSQLPVKVVYCDLSADEHPDNKRFAQDVERWLGHTIERIHSTKYMSVDDVITRERYFAGVKGGSRMLESRSLSCMGLALRTTTASGVARQSQFHIGRESGTTSRRYSRNDANRAGRLVGSRYGCAYQKMF